MYDFAIIILMGLAIFKVVDLLEDFVPRLASFHLLTTLALGVTGAVLLFSSPEKPAPATKAAAGGLRLLPVLTPQTQGAAATLRF